MKERQNSAPLVAMLLTMLLALPPIYVGSYFAMVSPIHSGYARELDLNNNRVYYHGYRVGGVTRFVFWPLECIDRSYLRPHMWPAK